MHRPTRFLVPALVALLVSASCSSADPVETGDSTTTSSTDTSASTTTTTTTTTISVQPAEPAALPFPECGPPGDVEPADAARTAELAEVRDRLDAEGLMVQPHVVSAGGPQNVWGVITVGLRARHLPTIEWLAERAGPDDLCLELPPVGYYDQPPTLANWELGAAGADPTQITLLVTEGACGLIDPSRILEPQVEYLDDQIVVAVPLRVPNWGPTIEPCPGPDQVPVTLTEDPGDRPTVAAEELLVPLDGPGPPPPN